MSFKDLNSSTGDKTGIVTLSSGSYTGISTATLDVLSSTLSLLLTGRHVYSERCLGVA